MMQGHRDMVLRLYRIVGTWGCGGMALQRSKTPQEGLLERLNYPEGTYGGISPSVLVHNNDSTFSYLPLTLCWTSCGISCMAAQHNIETLFAHRVGGQRLRGHFQNRIFLRDGIRQPPDGIQGIPRGHLLQAAPAPTFPDAIDSLILVAVAPMYALPGSCDDFSCRIEGKFPIVVHINGYLDYGVHSPTDIVTAQSKHLLHSPAQRASGSKDDRALTLQ